MNKEVTDVAMCKNCDRPVHDSYCGHCGQRSTTERITATYLLNEFFYFFTHLERGFLFTSWKMIVSPGISIKQFIEGNRMIYQKPVSYFVIWTAAYLLQLYLIGKIFGNEMVIHRSNYFGNLPVTEFATHYLSFTLGVLLPFYALYLYVVCVRKYFNYFESFIAVLYSLGTLLLLQVAFTFLAIPWYLITRQAVNVGISDVIKFIYVTWLGFDLVRCFPLKYKWLRVILYSSLCVGTFLLWRMYGLACVLELVNHK